MRIATYNVNGINGRLANLLGWLEEAAPDIVCLQELKAPDNRFPAAALRAAGYGAVWHGQKSWNGVAILARGAEPVEIRRGLPGDPDDTHSRYIEAAIGGIIASGDGSRTPFSREALSIGVQPVQVVQSALWSFVEIPEQPDRAGPSGCEAADCCDARLQRI